MEKYIIYLMNFFKANVPILVNTSFNLSDEPIVCTPGDAIRPFLKCNF